MKKSSKKETNNFEKQIIEYYLNNEISLRQLSKKFNVSRDIISRIFKNENIKIKFKRKNIAKYTKEIIEMYEATNSMNKVAEKFGVAVTYIRTILLKNNIKTSKGYNYRKGENNFKWNPDREFIKIKKKLGKAISIYIKKKGYIKQKETNYILGCSKEEFKIYIESKFEPWMNWNNYGNWNGISSEINKSWDLDHIVPLSSAKNIEELYKLNHYSNFQPLCSYINRKIKRNKI